MSTTFLRSFLENEQLLLPQRLQWLQRVAEMATQSKLVAYVVGGFVRDLLLERLVNDFDVVIEGDAISFANLLTEKHGGKITAHKKFGTAKWWPDVDENPASFLDLITARSETYSSPAALPTVKFSTLSDDIRRRDFTINTLAMRLDGDHFGELRDDLKGREDLENGLIRVLHPQSFTDDPTRLYRAIRYEQRYGFEIEPATLSLIPFARSLIEKLSAQRIRHELDLIFEEKQAVAILARLAKLDLIKAVNSKMPIFEPRYSPLLDSVPPADLGVNYDRVTLGYLLWLMKLPASTINVLAKRLAFTGELKKFLVAASKLILDLPALSEAKPSQWTARLDPTPALAVYAVSLVSDEISGNALQTYLQKWRYVRPFTTGEDLKKLGLPPGPRYQEILSQLRIAWLDGVVTTREEENSMLNRLA